MTALAGLVLRSVVSVRPFLFHSPLCLSNQMTFDLDFLRLLAGDWTSGSWVKGQSMQKCVCYNNTVQPNNINKPVFSFLRQLTTWHCPHLLQRGCCWPPALQQFIDISWSPGPQQQTRRAAAGLDRRTDARQMHIPCSAYYADSASNVFACAISCRRLLGHVQQCRLSNASSGGAGCVRHSKSSAAWDADPRLIIIILMTWQWHIHDITGWVIITMAMVDVDDSCQFSADSQPSRLAWSEGWRPPCAQSTFIRRANHSASETCKVSGDSCMVGVYWQNVPQPDCTWKEGLTVCACIALNLHISCYINWQFHSITFPLA